jgi:hypothetical protein
MLQGLPDVVDNDHQLNRLRAGVPDSRSDRDTNHVEEEGYSLLSVQFLLDDVLDLLEGIDLLALDHALISNTNHKVIRVRFMPVAKYKINELERRRTDSLRRELRRVTVELSVSRRKLRRLAHGTLIDLT